MNRISNAARQHIFKISYAAITAAAVCAAALANIGAIALSLFFLFFCAVILFFLFFAPFFSCCGLTAIKAALDLMNIKSNKERIRYD